MSGIMKKIGKVFKKIVKSKIFKVIAIAAAVYFTGGIALGAMGSGFAASLPGISAAANAIGMGGVGAIGLAGAEVAAAASAAVGVGGAGMGGGTAALFGAEAGSVGAGLLGEAAAAGAGAAGAAGGSLLGSIATYAPLAKTAVDVASDALGDTDALVEGAKATTKAAPSLADKGSALLKYFDSNPTVAKAALTFGSEGLKAGVGLYAQKSAQDAADERAQQDREDRNRREAAPILQNPTKGGAYDKGLVNASIEDEGNRP